MRVATWNVNSVKQRAPRLRPWLDERHIERALDLCTGSGCIGIAIAEYNPEWQVDIVDISEEALSLARENIVFQHVEGIHYNGFIKYFRSWIPDVPKGLLILIVPIEILSQFMRLISLSVRLYANMLAGHILILTMIGLVFIIHTPPWRFFGLPAAFVFYVFEVVIVVTIQAFIFAALSAIYIGTAIEPEH